MESASAWKMRNAQKILWESTRQLFWKQERKINHRPLYDVTKSFTKMVGIEENEPGLWFNIF